jgi:hypothetical protein
MAPTVFKRRVVQKAKTDVSYQKIKSLPDSAFAGFKPIELKASFRLQFNTLLANT